MLYSHVHTHAYTLAYPTKPLNQALTLLQLTDACLVLGDGGGKLDLVILIQFKKN